MQSLTPTGEIFVLFGLGCRSWRALGDGGPRTRRSSPACSTGPLTPCAARVGSAAGAAHGGTSDPDHAYTFGLALVLNGLAVLVDSPG